tara:strand:- start:221 stop:400 length:180 start_codon:yes stop_codon:yes gene_type:complete
MSLIKRIIEAIKCKCSCGFNEEYCPTKCKEYFDNINNLEINKKDILKIYNILNKLPSKV